MLDTDISFFFYFFHAFICNALVSDAFLHGKYAEPQSSNPVVAEDKQSDSTGVE